MSKYFKTALVLALICAVSAVSLSFLNRITEPKIKEYEESVVKKALESVAGGYDFEGPTTVQDNGFVVDYYKLTSNNKIVGYIVELVGKGYGGELKLAASYDVDGKINLVQLVSDDETPGVGKKAENEGYMDKFIGKGSTSPIPTSKDMLTDSEAQAVSGASITFGGISKALSEGSNFVKSLGGR